MHTRFMCQQNNMTYDKEFALRARHNKYKSISSNEKLLYVIKV